MLVMQLLVQKGSVDSSTQDWGFFAFVSSPSPGDRIAAERDGKTNFLTVLSVHHKPVAVNAAVDAPAEQPAADVVAIWTGSD